MACSALPLVALILISHSLAHAARLPSATTPKTGAPAPLAGAAKEYVDAHNKARAEVGVGPLKWNETLANATSRLVLYQRDKMSCQFANLIASKFGGNQLWTRGAAVSPTAAVDFWVGEKKYYNHDDNSCAPNHTCGVYTQVVWRKSLELGCAQAICEKEQASLTICFYNPPGNIIGESPY